MNVHKNAKLTPRGRPVVRRIQPRRTSQCHAIHTGALSTIA